MTQRGEKDAAFAVIVDPAERVISVRTYARATASSPLIQIGLFNIHAHQDAHFVARKGSFDEAVELILMDERLAPERGDERARRVIDLDGRDLGGFAVAALHGAEYLTEFRPVHRRVARAVISRKPAAFANETAQPGANLRIDEDLPYGVIQKDRVECSDPVVLEILQIVAEHRLIGARFCE